MNPQTFSTHHDTEKDREFLNQVIERLPAFGGVIAVDDKYILYKAKKVNRVKEVLMNCFANKIPFIIAGLSEHKFPPIDDPFCHEGYGENELDSDDRTRSLGHVGADIEPLDLTLEGETVAHLFSRK